MSELRLRIILNIDTPGKVAKLLPAMRPVATKKESPLNQQLAARGFRFTPQRKQVYDTLLEQRDHPTAEAVFFRAKKVMPDISMATVYNCLTALVKCGLVKQVTLERGAARFCPNMTEHCHFYCDTCDTVFDIELGNSAGIPLPRGFHAEHYDLAIHGRCPCCSKNRSLRSNGSRI